MSDTSRSSHGLIGSSCRMLPMAVLVAFLLLSPDAVGQAPEPHLSLETAEVRGIVLHTDGETPIPELLVLVWDADRERIVFRARTSDEGMFVVPRMPLGRQYVIVDTAKTDLRVAQTLAEGSRQPHDMVVVLPRRLPEGLASNLKPLPDPRYVSP